VSEKAVRPYFLHSKCKKSVGPYSVIAIAIACACSGESARRGAQPEERVHSGKVMRRDVVDRVLLAGTLHATQSEELRTPRTPMWELPIRWMPEDGALVKAGERALEFDNSSFVSSLAEKKLQYIDAVMSFNTFIDVSSLDEAQKTFELENARLVQAKAKVQASVPADLLPARTAQERQLDLKRSEAAVAKAEKELASAKAANQLERQVKQIELDKAKNTIADAEKAISELLLKAPRDGIIVIGDHPWMGRKFQIGDTVQPGWTIVSLPDLSSGMEVRAELSDVDDGRVSIGMQGTCTLDAYPADAMPCTVKALMPVASGKGGQSLRRGFAIVMSLVAVADKMRPGMSVKVELRRPPLANVVVVPRGAVQLANDKVRVKLASGELRDVELGPCDAQGCVVTKGLSDGESVAW
jgi:multidrug efflux pump subunit AcrA (membrane-fusion protein)